MLLRVSLRSILRNTRHLQREYVSEKGNEIWQTPHVSFVLAIVLLRRTFAEQACHKGDSKRGKEDGEEHAERHVSDGEPGFRHHGAIETW